MITKLKFLSHESCDPRSSLGIYGALVKERFWHKGSPELTHLYNAFLSSYSEYSKYLVDTLTDYNESKPTLKSKPKQKSSFCSSFKAHSMWYRIYHEYDNALLNCGYEQVAMTGYDLKRKREVIRINYTLKTRICIAAAVEAILYKTAFYIMKKEEQSLAYSENQLDKIFLHKLRSDIKNKRTILDVYYSFGGRKAYFVLTYIATSVFFICDITKRIKQLLKKDQVQSLGSSIRILNNLWGNNGIFRALVFCK